METFLALRESSLPFHFWLAQEEVCGGGGFCGQEEGKSWSRIVRLCMRQPPPPPPPPPTPGSGQQSHLLPFPPPPPLREAIANKGEGKGGQIPLLLLELIARTN